MNINVELGPPRKDGYRQVKLFLSRGPKRTRWAIPDVYVTSARWDAKRKQVKFGAKDHAPLNALITAARERAQTLTLQNPGIAPADLKDLLATPERRAGILLHDAFMEVYDNLEHRWRNGTKKQRRLVISDARKALPTTALLAFDGRDLLTLDRWYVAKGLATNSRRNRLRKFGTMYRYACKMHGVSPQVNPNEIAPNEVRPHKVRLTEEQVEILRLGSYHMPQRMKLAVDTWLLQYYMGGLRFNEACRLNTSMWDGKGYKWMMGKIERQRYHPVTERAKEIIDYYAGQFHVLPLVREGLTGDAFDKAVESANTANNEYLKMACELLGLPRLTTHTARHSAAQRMRNVLKDIHTTSKILGHATVKQTEAYLDQLDTTAIDRAFEELG